MIPNCSIPNWPLLLKLAGGQLRARVERNEPLAKALDYVQRALVKRGLTAFDSDNPHHRGEAVEATLGASLAELRKPDQVERLQELAIFPEDIDIPLRVVERYWSLDELDTEDLATRLDDLSLIDLDLGKATLKLHDEVRLYLERKLADHAALHARLVDRLPNPRPVEGASYDEASRYALAWGVHHLLGLPVAMERKVALSDLQLFVSFLGKTERPQFAPQDLFWNREMVAAQHVKVLVVERRESSPAAARRRNRSVGSLIREAVDRYLAVEEADGPQRPLKKVRV